MPWAILIPAFLCLCLGSYVSYTKDFKQGPWFLPMFLVVQIVTGFLWCFAARVSEPRVLFTFGLLWDLIGILAYSVLPLLVCGVRLSPTAWCGLALTVIGVSMVKWSH